jgi:uncharacterized DUF497 family protein
VNASSFFNRPLVAGDDERHSQAEKRFFVLGRTDLKKTIFLSFSRPKNNLIRVISAGDMSRKEREVYSNEEADTGFSKRG